MRVGTIEDVWCWGDNSKGQLGRGGVGSDPTPTPVRRIDGAWALGPTSHLGVSAGSAHVTVESVGWIWGAMVSSGVTPITTPAQPWAAAKSTGVGSIAVGRDHVCWTPSPHGVVRCDGNNWFGELGRGYSPTTALEVIAPSDWPAGEPHLRAWKVAGFERSNCAIADNGTDRRPVYCWGYTGGTTWTVNPERAGYRDALDVSVGAEHRYLRDKATGTWACWGMNDKAQCGLDPFAHGVRFATPTDTPWALPSLTAGFDFTCGINAGKVYCWGTNASGELGDGSEVAWSAAPREVLGLTNAISVSASEVGACAVKDDGTIWCWGRQQNGRFGKVADGTYRKPVRVEF